MGRRTTCRDRGLRFDLFQRIINRLRFFPQFLDFVSIDNRKDPRCSREAGGGVHSMDRTWARYHPDSGAAVIVVCFLLGRRVGRSRFG
jgi:hypothetical protein